MSKSKGKAVNTGIGKAEMNAGKEKATSANREKAVGAGKEGKKSLKKYRCWNRKRRKNTSEVINQSM